MDNFVSSVRIYKYMQIFNLIHNILWIINFGVYSGTEKADIWQSVLMFVWTIEDDDNEEKLRLLNLSLQT